MQVELDIFSGRPNPVWGLTAAQIDEMGEIVRTLPLATEEPPSQPGLGYRGFVVTDDARRSWRINAFKGFVQITDQGRVEVRSDRNRRLERWLLNSAGSQLAPEIHRRVPLD